ncbi:DGQHR domain-containing protein [Parasediminibacterium paludis]|uniref:DGQHR domain-containing protein n=1 Tax=Parasediminibacterium paludis TaxID=908966 RepID=A0ABV8PXS6_9BACT
MASLKKPLKRETTAKKTGKKKPSKILDPKIREERKLQRLHITEIRSIFEKIGFLKIDNVADKEIIFNGRKGDFDDVFIYQNIVLLFEYTISKRENIGDHLLKKKIIFDHVVENAEEFIDYLKDKFPTVSEKLNSYPTPEIKTFIIYCSKNEIKQSHKDQLINIKYLDFYVVKYFKVLANTIKKSARFELFKFLGLTFNDIGENISPSTGFSKDYKGSLLPHSYSNFAKGYKIVSFYIDPKTLIEKSYVLRKYGWLDDHGLYQRMIDPKKINQIREYLNKEERVFINNIIVTLPNETKLLDDTKNTIAFDSVTKTQPIEIKLPQDFNIIGLIDGQHRVFAYHEGGLFEEKIKRLREKQNLLVTGIIYPKNISDLDKTKFEAKLFLEINSTQTNAKSDLKQAIGLILKPFSIESVSRAVLEKLNQRGPLERLFEVNYFDKGKLKTTSIVSYGLAPLLKFTGNDSISFLWNNIRKNELQNKTDDVLLNEYILFCHESIDILLKAASSNLNGRWFISTKKELNYILNTTTINGFFVCLRKLIEHKKTGDFEYYRSKFSKLNEIDFQSFKSSQYGDLGETIFQKCFS